MVGRVQVFLPHSGQLAHRTENPHPSTIGMLHEGERPGVSATIYLPSA
jgi:hypothetical protein